MNKIKVLLVEDEDVLALIVKESLETRGFAITLAANGVEGWSLFNSDRPDICVVDIMMPRKDGFSLVSEIRMVDELIPIVFLTAKTQTADVLKGLELGADDYIKKPFSMEELILRLKALIRRSIRQPETDSPIEKALIVGQYSFHHSRNELSYENTTLTLSQRESDLLELLIRQKNNLLERKKALLKLWGDDNVFNSRSMDVYITRLRKCLRKDPSLDIVNIRGYGYKLIVRSN